MTGSKVTSKDVVHMSLLSVALHIPMSFEHFAANKTFMLVHELCFNCLFKAMLLSKASSDLVVFLLEKSRPLMPGMRFQASTAHQTEQDLFR